MSFTEHLLLLHCRPGRAAGKQSVDVEVEVDSPMKTAAIVHRETNLSRHNKVLRYGFTDKK